MTRKGMTLVSLMIVIAVIGILSAMMIFSSTEAIATAKAAKIIANLQILKRAAIAWYVDNRDKIVMSDSDSDNIGRVKINNKKLPIQNWSENDIQLSRYISGGNKSNINLHNKTENDSHTGNTNTTLKEGCYGICDGGTVKVPDGGVDKDGKPTYKTSEVHRSHLYVGYRFTEGEEAVREKIKGMMNTAGVFLGTADAHKDTFNDNSVAVWMRVL